MIFLPTRGRPENLARFFTHCMKTDVTSRIVVRTDTDDPNYPAYDAIMKAWAERLDVIHHAGMPFGFVGKCNDLFFKYPDEPWYACLQDDIVPRTKCWDILLRDAIQGGISYPDDGFQHDALPTNPFISGDLARAIGWLALPNVYHWYADNAWKVIGERIGKLHYTPSVLLEHHHRINGKAPDDATYQSADRMAEIDKLAFWRWAKIELAPLIKRIAT